MEYYRVRYGCGHHSVLSKNDLQKNVKAHQFNGETMTPENLYTCNACLNGEPGFCDKTTLHPITSAKKLSPLEIFQLGLIEKSGK